MKIVVILKFLTIFQLASSAKILIFVPGLSNSQIVFNYRVGDLLASHGHDVTLYRPQYNPDASRGKPSSTAKELKFKAVKNETMFRELQEKMESAMFSDSLFGGMSIAAAKQFTQLLQDGCEEQITNADLMKQLKDEKFDLAISHMYDFCPMGMIKALDIPTYIWMSSAAFLDYMAWAVGAPAPASFVPNAMSSFSDRMNFVQRFKNFIGHCMIHPFVRYMSANPFNEIFRRHYGENFPDLYHLAAKSPLVFVNSEELLDFPRPILHKVIYIGGIGMSNPKPLDEKWKKIMDDSKDGVVLFSFGSVANSTKIPREWKVCTVFNYEKNSCFKFFGSGSVFENVRQISNLHFHLEVRWRISRSCCNSKSHPVQMGAAKRYVR